MNKYIQYPSIILAVGFCKSGKTYSIQYTIRTTQKFDFIIVISNTAEFTKDYDYLKELGIAYRIYNTSKLTEMLQFCMNTQEQNMREGKDINVCIILDDCMGALTNNKTFQKLSSCFRHFKITLFILTQYCNSQTTYIRELANYVYCFDQRTESAKKAVYQSYFNDIDTFAEFKRTFAGLKAYQFYFIDRIGKQRFVMKCPAQQVVAKAENIAPKQENTAEIKKKEEQSAKAKFMANFY